MMLILDLLIVIAYFSNKLFLIDLKVWKEPAPFLAESPKITNMPGLEPSSIDPGNMGLEL